MTTNRQHRQDKGTNNDDRAEAIAPEWRDAQASDRRRGLHRARWTQSPGNVQSPRLPAAAAAPVGRRALVPRHLVSGPTALAAPGPAAEARGRAATQDRGP